MEMTKAMPVITVTIIMFLISRISRFIFIVPDFQDKQAHIHYVPGFQDKQAHIHYVPIFRIAGHVHYAPDFRW